MHGKPCPKRQETTSLAYRCRLFVAENWLIGPQFPGSWKTAEAIIYLTDKEELLRILRINAFDLAICGSVLFQAGFFFSGCHCVQTLRDAA